MYAAGKPVLLVECKADRRDDDVLELKGGNLGSLTRCGYVTPL